jgi:Ca-activated chloride channel family protein
VIEGGVDGLVFIRPWWLLGVVPVVVMAVLWARRRMAASHWESSIDPALLRVLLEPGSRGGYRRMAWTVAAALAIATVGLAGPAWHKLPQPVEEKRDALVIVFDLSLSMLARDVRPSRLIRARQKITDVLRKREEGYTALVAYAGDAHAVAPLTDDVRTIENLLASLSPEMMPVLGSNLKSALEVTRELLENARVQQGRILLVTDGIDVPADVRTLCERSFPLSVLGVGTARGGTIPLDFVNQPGQVLRTDAGDPITARLDSRRLAEAAENCHGHFRELALGDADITALLNTALPGEEETEEVEREFDTWADMGYLAGFLLLPLLLLGFRRGAFAVVALCLVPFPAEASFWDDLWQRPDQQAYEALNEGSPGVAAMLFKDDRWRAVAQYRAGDYAGAAGGFSAGHDPESAYNLGNALARAGNYEAALEAYDQTLAAVPDHEDARFNRELVERLLEEQRSQEQDSESEGDDGSNPQDQNSSQQPDDAQQQQQQGDGQEPDQPPEQDPSQQQEADADSSDEPDETEEGDSNRDERQDAMEQWLRRVPDDPGGLLRRKFQYETNQRLRRGDYSSRESEKIW